MSIWTRISNLSGLLGLVLLAGCGSSPTDSKTPAVLSIAGVEGQVVEDGALTLRGTGFGSGGTIISWDDFESHTDGGKIEGTTPPIGPDWESNEGTTLADVHDVHISSTRAVSGSQSARSCWNDGITSNWASRFGWKGQGPFTSVYISFHRYLDGAGPEWDAGSENHKAMYLFGELSQSRPQIVIGATQNGNTWSIGTNGKLSEGGTGGWFLPKWEGDDYFNEYGGTFKWSHTKADWQRWEIYTELNTPYTEANDKIQFLHDMRLMFESDTKQLSDGGLYEDLRFGNMDNGHDKYDFLYGYMDDVYVATSRARVEIGDNADFYKCTKRDIQVFTSWGNERIEFKLRTPSFSGDEDRFVFVVDRSGQWTSWELGD